MRVPIGVDGLAIVVHSSNTVQGLTNEQLRGLYNGKILDRSEVGGEAGEVLLVSREDGSGSRIYFESEIMQDEPVSLTAVVMPTSQDVIEYIAKTPNAIGYVSRALVMTQDGNKIVMRTPVAPNIFTEAITSTQLMTSSQTSPASTRATCLTN